MPSIITNGFPKSGNNALVKACQLLGVPCAVAHRAHDEGLPDGTTHHLFVTRDPRNVVISWLRFVGKPVTEGMALTTFRQFRESSLVTEMAAYEPWLSDPGALVVRFEDLIASDATMRRIADHLDVPYLDGAWEQLPGMTPTWTGKLIVTGLASPPLTDPDPVVRTISDVTTTTTFYMITTFGSALMIKTS